MARVTYEFADGIALITLDDGKVNALSPDMQAEINAALDKAEADQADLVEVLHTLHQVLNYKGT